MEFIQSFEGCSLKAYKALATEKYWTIGWGHYGPDITQGMTITQQQADDMFKNDLAPYCRAVDQSVTYPKTQNQFDAMVSLCYNIGTGGFRGSSVCSDLNKGKVQLAGDDFLKWTKSGGVVIPGLVRRRNAERLIFLNGYGGTPVVPSDPITPTDPNDPSSDSAKTIIKDDTAILHVKLLLSDSINGWYR